VMVIAQSLSRRATVARPRDVKQQGARGFARFAQATGQDHQKGSTTCVTFTLPELNST